MKRGFLTVNLSDKKRQVLYQKRHMAVRTNLGKWALCGENIKVPTILSDSDNLGHETTYQ